MKYAILFIGLLLQFSCSYLPDDSNYIEKDFSVSETNDYIELKPNAKKSNVAIVFIPGGLVDPHAYIKTFQSYASDLGVLVLIPKVRGNLAILNPKSVSRVTKNFDNYTWVIGGHSLGGVLAAKCIKDEPEKWSALFFQGSYSTYNISDYAGPVFSCRGSEDGLTKKEDWEKYQKNLPEAVYVNQIDSIKNESSKKQTIYFTIEGGNHAQFGNYGAQKKDGEAKINASSQQEIFNKVLIKILRNNEFQL